MIEVPIELEIVRGLTPNKETRQGSRVCSNLRPKDDMLVPVLQPYDLWPHETIWPWPQMFVLDKQLYVCFYDAIYLARPEGLELLLDNIPDRRYPWGAAIMGHFPVFVNNYSVVYPTAVSALTERMDDVPYTGLAVQAGAFPICRDVCNVNNQFVVASPWMYRKWHRQHVAWARPGTIDFEINEATSAGYRYVQDCGDILRVVPSDDGFIAYGTQGITRFALAEYPASYAHKKISKIGLYSQLAVTNALGSHFYVGTDYQLHQVVGSEVKDLDYSYKFSDAIGEIVLNYDEDDKVIYASL